MRTLNLVNEKTSTNRSLFKFRATSALLISIVADALDYFAVPLFGVPILGDIFDAVIVSLLYSITRSKMSAAINMVEFIPFIGDFIPVYTLSTLMWIAKELATGRRNIKVETKMY